LSCCFSKLISKDYSDKDKDYTKCFRQQIIKTDSEDYEEGLSQNI
jgi:hypothetical protein